MLDRIAAIDEANKQIRVLVVYGTRPEAIKLAPIINKMQEDDRFEPIVCFTGQHKDMADHAIDYFNLVNDYSLDVMTDNQSLSSLSALLIQKLDEVFLQEQNLDWVMVQGDTTSAFMGALVAHYHKVKVTHVEAGLRSMNGMDPFPEEGNRRLIGVLSNLDLAPTSLSKVNLLNEGKSDEQIEVVGNSVIDALTKVDFDCSQHNKKYSNSRVLDKIINGRPYVLITSHRRENIGEKLENICKAIAVVAENNPDTLFIFPVHKNPKVRDIVEAELSKINNVVLLEPLKYTNFIHLMKNCKFILTDSGGLQEEAPYYSKPVLVMRETTERVEGIYAGVSKLIGTDTIEIIKNVELLLRNKDEYNNMSKFRCPYGKGNTAEKILNVINAKNNDDLITTKYFDVEAKVDIKRSTQNKVEINQSDFDQVHHYDHIMQHKCFVKSVN